MSVKNSFPTHPIITASRPQMPHKHTKTCLLQLNKSVSSYETEALGLRPTNIFREHL